MTRFEFKNLEFTEEENEIKVLFLKRFHFQINKKDLTRIGRYTLETNAIEFNQDNNVSEQSSQEETDEITRQFNFILSRGFSNLTGLFGRKAIYIHKHSNIPLIGNLGFGIVDRNTNALELKPITDCNLDCVFCSVDEGKSSKKITDFIVESDYLIEETKKILEFKEVKTSIHINPHGEPLIYADLVDLIKGVSKLKNAGMIAIYTNGVLLSEKLIDDLTDAGLNRLSISLHSLDDKKASELAGTNYSAKHVIEMIQYAKNKPGLEVILSPVYIPRINESDVEEVVKFAKENNLIVTIQNFLNYKLGRNPSKQVDFDKFFKKLGDWQEKYGINLRPDKDSKFIIEKTKKLPMPFKTGDLITASIVCPGRYPNEMIAVSQERTIVVPDCKLHVGEKANLKIEKSKDNIFIGTIAKGKSVKIDRNAHSGRRR